LNLDEFLAQAKDFKLGMLPTEWSHPKTRNLSFLSKNNINKAISLLKEIELEAISFLKNKELEFSELNDAIKRTLSNSGRIFLCGCGATGRLSILLEFINRKTNFYHENKLIGFMAGGDVALIRAVEPFEDLPNYGERQLKELGFTKDDLLISSTEGGETPFVIGATLYASSITMPFFLFCNDESILIKIERSRNVLTNKKIKSVSIPIGPMSLSGSTRLEACTVLMLGIGLALFSEKDFFISAIDSFLEKINNIDFSFLSPFIEKEADIYLADERVLYSTNEYGMTILTDTTERAPTFSLVPFENFFDSFDVLHSLAYIHLPHTVNASDAWETLLGRKPRTIEWPELFKITGYKRLMGYDFSLSGRQLRKKRIGKRKEHIFSIDKINNGIHFSFDELNHKIDIDEFNCLEQHILLKILLNIHSTLVMGRLSRYEGNSMTYVKPSNKKLIDRSIRYILNILSNRGIDKYSYEEVAKKLFDNLKKINPTDSIVLKTAQDLEKSFRNKVS